MRKIAVAAVFLLALTGCASISPYGNYLGESVDVNQDQLAAEAVNQLVTLYPPAKVRLELQQPTPDAFGMALVKGLRERGYAVLEFNPKAAKAATSSAPASTAKPLTPSAPSASQTWPLRYVVDQAGSLNLYRLTLMVGSQSVTRPYVHQNGELTAVGYWVRRE
jgi:hypothetical protein